MADQVSNNYLLVQRILKVSLKIILFLSLISLLPICYRKEYLRTQYTNFCNRKFIDKIIYGQNQDCEFYKLELNSMENQCIVGDIGIIRTFWLTLKQITFFPKIQPYINNLLGY